MNMNNFSLAQTLGQYLKQSQEVVATAESCTGGMIGAALTDVAGSSAWFECGCITYSNAIKTQLLGVPAQLLATYGAVSEQVTTAMVSGLLERYQADIGVAVSGIAGPGGGSPDKPVGTVCFTWGRAEKLISSTQTFSGDRASIRLQATEFGLRSLVDYMANT